MFKEMSQLGSLLKQAQGLTGKVKDIQEKLASARLTGSSGDARVQIVLTGQGEVVSCTISPEILHPDMQTAIERGVVEAVNSAFQTLKQRTAAEMSEATGGLDLSALGSMMGFGGRTGGS